MIWLEQGGQRGARGQVQTGGGGRGWGVALAWQWGTPRQGGGRARVCTHLSPLRALVYEVTWLGAWPGAATHISLGPRQKLTLDKCLIFLGFCFLACK